MIARVLNRLAGGLLAFVLLFGMYAGVTVRSQQGALSVDSSGHEVKFGQEIAFLLEVSAPRPLQAVSLYYRLAGEGVTVKKGLLIEPGQARLVHRWKLDPGDIPVGKSIEYRWLVKDDAGQVVETDWTSFAYNDDRFPWKMVHGDRIELHWYGGSEQEARRLFEVASAALDRLEAEVGVTLDQVVNIFVYRSKADMSLALPRRSEAYDDRILTLGVVVDQATLLLLGTHADVESTMAHELSHIVVGLAAEGPYSSIPRWLDEGLAMYAEGELGEVNRKALEEAIRQDRLISVRSLSGYAGDPSQVDLFYGEVHSLIDFMLDRYGKDRMADLLSAIKEGLYQEDALKTVYGFGLDELDRAWREHLGLAPRSAAVAVPTVQPTPSRAEKAESFCGSLIGFIVSILSAMVGMLRARVA